MSKSSLSEQYTQFRLLLIQGRKAAGITQTELSLKLSRPQSYVSKYERGERRLDLIEFLEVAELLNINPTDFIEKLLNSKQGN